MRNWCCILILLLALLTAGCKATEPVAGTVSHTMLLHIRGTGNMNSQVLEAISKVKYLKCIRVINEKSFLDYYQQMEIEIDVLDFNRLSLLQKELSNIPGVLTVTIL